ncbi:MAG: low molecular weight phosphatase family protein [Acidobacteriia bacterium]|nr:low molecular weight phosphatase family protein [Terriglobia bacterium]
MVAHAKVLFLCVGNACRSQMAEAIAKAVAADVIEPTSAGLVPFGEITGPTLEVLGERGFSADGQYSKPLVPEELHASDLVVNMTGRSGSAIFTESTPPVEDWDVGDPFGFNLAVYRAIRDQIESRVEDLARRLRERAISPGIPLESTKAD